MRGGAEERERPAREEEGRAEWAELRAGGGAEGAEPGTGWASSRRTRNRGSTGGLGTTGVNKITFK